MGIVEGARHKLLKILGQRRLDTLAEVVVRPLTPEEAIGVGAAGEFPIKRGRERVVEASFLGARGQAFTDQPMPFRGTLGSILELDLSQPGNRAVFVAALNAVLRHLGLADGTVHCKEEDPQRCGPEIAEALVRRFGRRRIGLVGLQPAILEALVRTFGPPAVRLVDLNPDNIGKTKHGVKVWDGGARLRDLVAQSDVVLATGSSVVNGTIDEIMALCRQAGKPLVFYGNTISGVAALEKLDRLCPFGQ